MIIDIAKMFVDPLFSIGPKIPGLILSLLFGYVVIWFLTSLLKNSMRIARIPGALANLIISLTAVLLWVILFSELARQVGLSSLAVKISGSLLVVGLAIANGMSALAGDIVAGVFLAKDRDFEVGFRIKTGDIEGVIKKIDIRKVRLEDDDKRLYIVPNSKIDSNGWVIIARDKK